MASGLFYILKEFTCQCKRHRFDPGSETVPWRKEWLSTLVKIHGQRSLEGYSPPSCKESDMTEHASTCAFFKKYCLCVLYVYWCLLEFEGEKFLKYLKMINPLRVSIAFLKENCIFQNKGQLWRVALFYTFENLWCRHNREHLNSIAASHSICCHLLFWLKH